MRVLRHAVAGMIILTMFASLFVLIYDGSSETYGFENDTWELNYTYKDNSTSEGNIAYHLQHLNLISGIETMREAVQDIKPPTGATEDWLGGLKSVAFAPLQLISGFTQSVVGVATAPFEVINIITKFYGDGLPDIGTYLGLIVLVYVMFIVLRVKIGEDI